MFNSTTSGQQQRYKRFTPDNQVLSILYNTVNNMANWASKRWCLTKVETVNSYENWRQNLLYTLSLDPNFLPYLEDGATWGKKPALTPIETSWTTMTMSPRQIARPAHRKSGLELMLGQIANLHLLFRGAP